MRDIGEAPAALRQAAKAVVRISAPGGSGTGFFARSAQFGGRTLLVTNFHVVGGENCPLAGCRVELARGLEKGSRPTDDTVVLKPVGASGNFDVALYEVYDSFAEAKAGKSTYVAPAFLEVDPKRAPGEDVYVVGHPYSGLKKISEGKVFETKATQSYASAMALPGNSGSPVLDAQGRLVGILWGGHTDSFGADRIVHYSVFARADAIAAQAKSSAATLAKLYVDATKPLTVSSYLAAPQVFAASEDAPLLHADEESAESATPDGTREILVQDCMAKLEDVDTADPRTGQAAMASCMPMVRLVECRPALDGAPVPVGAAKATFCPTGSAVTTWRSRFKAIANALTPFRDFDALAFQTNTARFSTTRSGGSKDALAAVRGHLARNPQPLDFDAAYIFLRLGLPPQTVVSGKNVAEFVRGYAKQPLYELSIEVLFWSHFYLMADGVLSKEEFLSVTRNLYNDPAAPLRERLSLEETLLREGLLALIK
jgi:hypothetical protein